MPRTLPNIGSGHARRRSADFVRTVVVFNLAVTINCFSRGRRAQHGDLLSHPSSHIVAILHLYIRGSNILIVEKILWVLITKAAFPLFEFHFFLLH
jgi:hypothetical protein